MGRGRLHQDRGFEGALAVARAAEDQWREGAMARIAAAERAAASVVERVTQGESLSLAQKGLPEGEVGRLALGIVLASASVSGEELQRLLFDCRDRQVAEVILRFAPLSPETLRAFLARTNDRLLTYIVAGRLAAMGDVAMMPSTGGRLVS